MIYFHREERETVREAERLRQEEEALLLAKEKKLLERKEESRALLLQSIQREEAEQTRGGMR